VAALGVALAATVARTDADALGEALAEDGVGALTALVGATVAVGCEPLPQAAKSSAPISAAALQSVRPIVLSRS
jgi:hypothetical protein